MKRVLIVFHDHNIRSGATASMLDLLSELIHHDDLEFIALVPKKGELTNRLNSMGLQCIVANYYSGRYSAHSLTAKFSGIVKAIVKFFITSITLIKIIKKIKNIDVVYINTSDNYIGLLLSIFTRKKTIVHIREFGFEDQRQKHIITDTLYYWLINNKVNRVIVISKALNQKISSLIDNKKISLIYDDVSICREPILQLESSQRVRKFIIVGTLCEGKGQKIVLDAFRKIKNKGFDVELKIIGDDITEYANYLKSLVVIYKLEDCVSFSGFINDLRYIRRENDVCIIPSLSEAFGRVTIESMASGILVIASNSGANSELIKDNINGFLFESGSVDSLSRVIEHVISLSPRTISAVKREALIMSGKYTSGKAAEQVHQIITSL